MPEYSLEIVFVVEPSARSERDQLRWALTVARSAVAFVARNRRVHATTLAKLQEHYDRPPHLIGRAWNLTPTVGEAEDAGAE